MNRFAPTTPTAIAKAFAEASEKQLTTVCPLSGLLVPNNFPAYPGALFSGTIHPVVAEAANLVKLGDSYLTTLSNEQITGLLLALLNHYKKLDLIGPAFLVRASLESKLTGGQVLTFVKWFSKSVQVTKRGQPKLTLSIESDETTFDAYMKIWVQNERFYSDTEHLIASLKVKAVDELPAFLSNASQAKKLNKACFEAFKELANYLPKALVTKMKPFAADLATSSANGTRANMFEAIKRAVGADEELMAGSDEVEAANDFFAVVEAKRAEAKELGLDKEEWLFDDLEEAIQAHKTVKAIKKYHAEVPGLGLTDSAEAILDSRDSLPTEPSINDLDLSFCSPSLPAQPIPSASVVATLGGQPVAKPMSFAAKLAAAKAAKESK